jgi:hypothetical protein
MWKPLMILAPIMAAALSTIALAVPAHSNELEYTAEKHFAAVFANKPAGILLFDFGRRPPEMAQYDTRKLSPNEFKKLQDRLRRAELADLVLYGQKCRIHWEVNQNGVWIGAMDDANYKHVTALFAALPEEQRTEAIEHERKTIEARPDIENIKGGWNWFCNLIHDRIIDGTFNNFVVPMPKLHAVIGRGSHAGGGIYSSGYWHMWLHVVNRGTEFYRLTKWSCTFSYKGEMVYEDTFYVEQVAARFNTDKMMTLFTNRGIDHGQCRLLDAIKSNSRVNPQ